MNRIALQHGFDVLVNGTSGIEIVTSSDSRRHLEEGQNKGTLLKFKVEQQLSCSTNCKPHNIYNDEGRFLLPQNEEIQKTLNKHVQEYVKYELEDKSEVDCSSCGAWDWKTSDFSSHVSPEDYEDVQEFVHAESLLLDQEFQRNTELNERLDLCDYNWAASQKRFEVMYLSCIASAKASEKNAKISKGDKNRAKKQCNEEVYIKLHEAQASYDKCFETANFIYNSTQSSLIDTYEDLNREVSKDITEIFSSVSSIMMDTFNKLVDDAKKKKAELIEAQRAMALVVEENIVCDISGATDESPSIEDIETISTLFQFSLNSAYLEVGLNKRMKDFYFYESCLLDAEILESLECVDQSNRQLLRSRNLKLRLRGILRNNGRASASRSKKLRPNRRSLTSIQEDPTHDAMEPKHKHVGVHRRMKKKGKMDKDAFVEHVNRKFGNLYMTFYYDLIEDNTEFSVDCSLPDFASKGSKSDKARR